MTLNSRLDRACYALALLLGILPLWVGRHLPMVDLPQHLYLISVLHRLDDTTTLYPQLFAQRSQLTPYLGYYYAVSALHWLFPLLIANKIFLSAYVIGLPLSLAVLLRSVGRPIWPSLLALPFAYGDSFGWGFINFCAAIPLGFLCCAFFIRALSNAGQRARWSTCCSIALVAVLLFHVQVFAFLALALPLILLTTRAADDGRRNPATPAGAYLKAVLGRRLPALLSLIPGILLFFVWVIGRLGEPAQVDYGAPWKAWGPVLSSQNLSFKTFAQNREELPMVLANLLRDGSDRYPLFAVLALFCVALLASFFPAARNPTREGPIARWRLPALGLVALAFYFAMPFDIRGYMYYLNTRFAHLAAPLLVCAVPALRERLQRPLLLAATGCAALLAIVLGRGFWNFHQLEAAQWDELAEHAAARPRVMGLIFDPFSRISRHPVLLHSAAILALERGGVPNFSFAITPHSPLRYRGTPPPTFPSEWRPDQFRYEKEGGAYDHFLLRGISPAQMFGPLLDTQLAVTDKTRDFWLVSRR